MHLGSWATSWIAGDWSGQSVTHRETSTAGAARREASSLRCSNFGAKELRKVGAEVAKDTRQQHILVVNDTPEILDMFQVLLGDEGFQVTVDRFTVEAGEMHCRIKKLKPDLIVLDYMIGREDSGWQVLQLLKMDPATRDIPVVICTAAVQQVEQIRNHLDEMGVGVVLKPFDIDHLLD